MRVNNTLRFPSHVIIILLLFCVQVVYNFIRTGRESESVEELWRTVWMRCAAELMNAQTDINFRMGTDFTYPTCLHPRVFDVSVPHFKMFFESSLRRSCSSLHRLCSSGCKRKCRIVYF